MSLSVVLEGVVREGETTKTTPIGPPVPDDLKATLSGTKHFGELANDKHGAWWDAAIKMYDPYPAFYFDEEIQKADVWILANPRRRPRDLRKFLTNWFSRALEGIRREEARTDAMKRGR